MLGRFSVFREQRLRTGLDTFGAERAPLGQEFDGLLSDVRVMSDLMPASPMGAVAARPMRSACVRKTGLGLGWLLPILLVAGCGTTARPVQPASRPVAVYVAPRSSTTTTVASWYGPGFNGHRTSTGEVYDQHQLTAASRTLPLGSSVRVTNLDTGRSTIVRINDRGPFVRGRGIDLSRAAADQVGLTHEGVARVRLTRLDRTASAVPETPDVWSGHVRVRHRYSSHRYRHRTISNPVGTWLVELIR
jgi:rare lipoprotein A (peptidoglycan hydrolase)